jgi:hypothetical protein
MAADEVPQRLRGDAGGQQPDEPATKSWARRSAACYIIRAPVNCQATITLARSSTALPSAQPVSAADPADRPCHSPMAPSAHIHARLAHDSRRGGIDDWRQALLARWAGSLELDRLAVDMQAVRSPAGRLRLLTVRMRSGSWRPASSGDGQRSALRSRPS